MEISKGRSEEEVVASLGDPRLLDKSIIEANKRAGISEGTNRNYDEETTDGKYGTGQDESSGTAHMVRMPTWLILLIVGVIALLVIGVVFSVISFLAPIIIPVLIVVLVVNYIRGR